MAGGAGAASAAERAGPCAAQLAPAPLSDAMWCVQADTRDHAEAWQVGAAARPRGTPSPPTHPCGSPRIGRPAISRQVLAA